MLKISKDISLPKDFATQTMAILAKRRVGKTYTASVIAEECCENKIPFVVLDPTGAWWGLRSSSDGKKDGYPVVIIGGSHGDIPLEMTGGKVVAEFIVDHPGYYIIDLSQSASDAEQDRFATDFADRLYRLKEKHREPLHLFVDEADAFVPQRPFPNQTRMLGAFEALVRRGGIRGIGLTLISQRASIVNKNVLNMTESIVALQTTAPLDQDAVDDWVKRNATKELREQFMKELASLQQGEAWFYSPAWLEVFKKVTIRERRTFNSSATPKVGDKPQEPAKLAEVDLEALRTTMATTIEKAKADDPVGLRKQIAELRKTNAEISKQLAEKPQTVASEPAFPQETADGIMHGLNWIDQDVTKALDDLTRISQWTAEVRSQLGVNSPAPKAQPKPTALAKPTAAKPAAQPQTTPVVPKQSAPPSQSTADPSAVNAYQLGILNGLAELEAIGIDQPTRVQLSFVTGKSAKSSHFEKMIGSLRTGGYIDYPSGGTLCLSAIGRGLAVADKPPASLRDFHDRIRTLLDPYQVRMFNALTEAYPDSLSREDLAQKMEASITSSHFEKKIGSLKTMEILTYPQDRHVRAADMLFPEGLQ